MPELAQAALCAPPEVELQCVAVSYRVSIYFLAFLEVVHILKCCFVILRRDSSTSCLEIVLVG